MANNSGSGDSKNTLYCSFCGKSQHEVRKLIAGPTVFICDEFYRGRRFRCDQISAVWFMEEDQVKIHAPDGTCLATWDANELAERFQDGQAKTLPMPSTRPSVMPQADIRRAA